MPRSEAQKAADKRYKEKNKSKIYRFYTELPLAQGEELERLLKENSMSKADGLRLLIENLSNK